METKVDDPGVAFVSSLICTLCDGTTDQEARQLIACFEKRQTSVGDIIWMQGSPGKQCALLISGLLLSTLEEEAGTTETVHAGNFVGEYSLLSGERHTSTMSVLKAGTLLVLSEESFRKCPPNLQSILYRVCIAYLGHRCLQVTNRVWESHCVPI